MPAGRPLKFKSVAELEFAIDTWIDLCEEKKEVPTVSGLAYFLGCDRQTLLNYQEKDEFFGTIKKAKAFIEFCVEQKLFQSGIATGTIFNLKNNFGWKDRSETDITSGGEKLQPLLVKFLENDNGNTN